MRSMRAASLAAAGHERVGDSEMGGVTLGNKLSMATQLASLLVLLATILLAWAKVDTRVTMAEHRIIQLEAAFAAAGNRREADNLILGRVVSQLEAQNVQMQNMTEAMRRFDGQMERLRPLVPR